jgi:hypothetical protein
MRNLLLLATYTQIKIYYKTKKMENNKPFNGHLTPNPIILSEEMKNWIRFTILVYSVPFAGR